MSERKVLNKYYPPDYDPANVPRVKIPGGRNKTFVIRLMAPCNMRCTTCGEYIYKGRKFNARKEDVDDMNHLGLRIYRFYIKCTACVSEISFRTDPANTDYVLEAGATRNFEALAKAEKLEEQKQKAHEEELKTNPMKLLEERTEASKNEMSRMEALEELQEINKRGVKIDYDSMLTKYDKLRELEAKAQEDEDEKLVNELFAKENGQSIKRIIDDDENEDDEKARFSKQLKVEKATDFLAGGEKDKKKESWQKSVGTLGGSSKGKMGLGIVVKKKSKPAEKPPASTEKPSASTEKPSTSTEKASTSTEKASTSTEKPTTSTEKPTASTEKPSTSGPSTSQKPPTNALSLLGNYSDSSEDSS